MQFAMDFASSLQCENKILKFCEEACNDIIKKFRWMDGKKIKVMMSGAHLIFLISSSTFQTALGEVCSFFSVKE